MSQATKKKPRVVSKHAESLRDSRLTTSQLQKISSSTTLKHLAAGAFGPNLTNKQRVAISVGMATCAMRILDESLANEQVRPRVTKKNPEDPAPRFKLTDRSLEEAKRSLGLPITPNLLGGTSWKCALGKRKVERPAVEAQDAKRARLLDDEAEEAEEDEDDEASSAGEESAGSDDV